MITTGRWLRDTRVLDLSDGLAGAYCVKLLADAGAEVVRPARPEAGFGPESLVGFLRAGAHVVEVDATDIARLARLSDVVVHDGSLHSDAVSVLAQDASGVVIASVTPFGTTGPYAARPANDFTLQAASGGTATRGTPDRPPVQAGGRIGDWAAGVTAALGVLGALRIAVGGGFSVDSCGTRRGLRCSVDSCGARWGLRCSVGLAVRSDTVRRVRASRTHRTMFVRTARSNSRNGAPSRRVRCERVTRRPCIDGQENISKECSEFLASGPKLSHPQARWMP